MTEATQQTPPVDAGNPFVGPDYPALLTTAQVQTPAGPRLLLTVRCGPATVTVNLAKQDAKVWASQLEKGADALTGLIVPGLNMAGLTNGHAPSAERGD